MGNLKLFESQDIRTHWDNENEQWLFSVIDVVENLTDSSIPKRYWSDLKQKLQKEGSEVYENIVRFKLEASDGKLRETDVADTETLLRIIQSIPSPKAEPFKQWLAKVGYERTKEFKDPEQIGERAIENWQKSGRSEKWIQQRTTGRETLNKFAGYWKQGGAEKSSGSVFPASMTQVDWGED